VLAQMGEERTLRAESRFARSRNLVRSPIFECSCLRYGSVRSDGPLFMNATAKIGTAAHAGATRAWAPAALACMGIVFGEHRHEPALCAQRRRKGREC
jgi:hypothetical protein